MKAMDAQVDPPRAEGRNVAACLCLRIAPKLQTICPFELGVENSRETPTPAGPRSSVRPFARCLDRAGSRPIGQSIDRSERTTVKTSWTRIHSDVLVPDPARETTCPPSSASHPWPSVPGRVIHTSGALDMKVCMVTPGDSPMSVTHPLARHG